MMCFLPEAPPQDPGSAPVNSQEAGPSVTEDEEARKKTFDPISNV